MPPAYALVSQNDAGRAPAAYHHFAFRDEKSGARLFTVDDEEFKVEALVHHVSSKQTKAVL
jgi:hypothetical protein